MKLLNIILAAVSAAFIVGCEKPDSSIDENSKVNSSNIVVTSTSIYMDNSNTNVVLMVNDKNITKQECIDQCMLMIKIAENRIGSEYTGAQRTAAIKRAVAKLPRFFTLHLGIEDEIAQSNFVCGAVTDKFKSTYLRGARRPRQSLSDMVSKMDKRSADTLMYNMTNDFRMQMFIQTCFSNDLVVTAADVAASRRNINEYNSMADKTNSLTIARAEKARAEILSGVSPSIVAEKYSENTWDEDRTNSVEILETEYDDFIWNEIVNIKIGVPSKVFEIEDGYVFFVKTTPVDPDTVTAHKIFFRRAAKAEFTDDDEIYMELATEKRQNVMKKLVKRIFSNSEIYYPIGDNDYFIELFNDIK